MVISTKETGTCFYPYYCNGILVCIIDLYKSCHDIETISENNILYEISLHDSSKYCQFQKTGTFKQSFYWARVIN